MLVLAGVALVLIALDSLTPWLQPAHRWLASVAWPFYWVTSVPARIREWGEDSVLSRAELEAENERLTTELLVYQGQLQRMIDLAAENIRLRHLLNATELLEDHVLVTELVGVSPDPLKHVISINRGAFDKVYVGQPLIDSEGLMGQVTEVYDHHARVLLVTDSSHALPVKVARSGVRVIVEGTGDYRLMKLRHVSPTQDIEVGDALVSSGLGGRFPEGYPVGTVTELVRPEGQDFVEVTVTPTAQVDRSRHLLLVFSDVVELVKGAESGSQ